MRPAHVEVHIEELVLHGFPPLDRAAVGEAVRDELARLLVRDGVTSFEASAAIDGGRLELEAPTPQAIGPGVARMLRGAVGR